MKKLNAISLFTGCGGLDLGFEASGFKIHFAADVMPEACETLKNNHNDLFVFGPPSYSGDVGDLSWNLISEKTGLKKGDVDMVIGGPPCQSFSVAAAQRFLKADDNFKRKGFACPKNGNLIFEYFRLIREIEPKAFLIENVPGIVKIDGGETIDALTKMYSEIGYTLQAPIFIDAAKYGVPQVRTRVFLIGTKKGGKEFFVPKGQFGDDIFSKKTFRTVCQALIDITSDFTNHETRNHKKQSIERYKKLKRGEREKLGRVDRLDPDCPSKTVIAGGSNGGGRSHLHPFLARTLSVRECARLQTFPDDYIFFGKNGRQFTQVGNAVPPLLAEHIARAIGHQLFDLTYEHPLKLEKTYQPFNEAHVRLLMESYKNHRDLCYNDIELYLENIKKQSSQVA